MNLLRILFAAIIPPLGMFFTVGIGKSFWINIILTLCGYIPGVIHAVYVIGQRSQSGGAAMAR